MYYFFLGHQPDLAALELQELVEGKLIQVSKNIYQAPEIRLDELSDKLGGTQKIAKLQKITSREALFADLVELISEDESKNIALTNFTSLPIEKSDIRKLKGEVTKIRPVRFVSFEDRNHEQIMLRKQHVSEYNILEDASSLIIAQSVWFSDNIAYAERDRRKPYQDIKRGMLPVKIARMMVNLATAGKRNLRILDPFCGTGTILLEAAVLGHSIVGSDLSEEAVNGAKANYTWLKTAYKLEPAQAEFYSEDATRLTLATPVDCVVTEPYMGPLQTHYQLDQVKLKNIARGLDKLYRGSLRNLRELMRDHGRVVIAIPGFSRLSNGNPVISVDTLESLGYNYLQSVRYEKSGSQVIRHITVLEKN